MQTRRIGDRTVSAIGLGGMPMSVRPTNDEEQGVATIRTAVENGVTLVDSPSRTMVTSVVSPLGPASARCSSGGGAST